jgi:Fe-Mn family superoxide dismutase
VGDHEIGHPAGWTPVLVMDVWEHAFMVDHGASGRKEYVEAFLENVNWDIVERRFEEHRAQAA